MEVGNENRLHDRVNACCPARFPRSAHTDRKSCLVTVANVGGGGILAHALSRTALAREGVALEAKGREAAGSMADGLPGLSQPVEREQGPHTTEVSSELQYLPLVLGPIRIYLDVFLVTFLLNVLLGSQ
jgi:hypothetical protein